MKYITITQAKINELEDFWVAKDPNYDQKASRASVRALVWNMLIKPVEGHAQCNLDFLYSFVKIKDAQKEIIDNPDMETIALEDSDFEILYNNFCSYNQWQSEMARAILLASDSLKAAKDGKNERPKGKTNRRS